MVDRVKESKEIISSFPQTLMIGGSGFVGSRLLKDAEFLGDKIIVPSLSELDIMDKESIRRSIRKNGAEAVINLAAYTDVKKADVERKEALRLNVVGARNVAEVCKEEKVFLVHISTDNVFLGSHGPSAEEDRLTNDGLADWYGYTKRLGEEEIRKVGGQIAIVRIAYPFGNPNPEKDYILKLIQAIKNGKPIFADQRFTPTYLPLLSEALWKIVAKKIPGKFHVACRGRTTPYKIGIFLAKELKLDLKVKRGSVSEYEKNIGKKSPYNMQGGLRVEKTEEILDLTFPTWKEAVKDFICRLPLELV